VIIALSLANEKKYIDYQPEIEENEKLLACAALLRYQIVTIKGNSLLEES